MQPTKRDTTTAVDSGDAKIVQNNPFAIFSGGSLYVSKPPICPRFLRGFTLREQTPVTGAPPHVEPLAWHGTDAPAKGRKQPVDGRRVPNAQRVQTDVPACSRPKFLVSSLRTSRSSSTASPCESASAPRTSRCAQRKRDTGKHGDHKNFRTRRRARNTCLISAAHKQLP